MSSLKNIFPNGFRPPVELAPLSPENQLRVAMSDAGIVPPDDLILDGTLRRFGASGKTKDKSGWYVGHDGEVPAGAFGDWKTGQECHWRADIGRELTFQESAMHAKRMIEVKAKREKELTDSREYAAHVATQTWESAQLASDDHPYIKRKGIANPGWHIASDGRLIAPMLIDGEISGLQYISDDGTKMFLKSSKTGGAHWAIGPDYTQGEERIYISEGIATAASVFEATGRAVVVSYSAGNISATAQAIRAKVGPLREIVIVADNDDKIEEKLKENWPGYTNLNWLEEYGVRYAKFIDAKGVEREIHNVGVVESYKAAEKISATVIFPPCPKGDAIDANDFAQAGGDLSALLEPVESMTAATERLNVVFADALGSEFNPPDELVEGLLTVGASSVVYGDSNSGKTFFVLDMGCAIARGVEWMGRKTEPGLVIYLATEAPASIKTRIQAYQKHHNCTVPNFAIVQTPVNFHRDNKDTKDIVTMVEEVERALGQKARLIVGDTLARISSGANENSGDDMGPIMERFDYLARKSGAHVLIIHHNGKDAAKGARGWSGIRAHIDTEIELKDENNIRTASITKQRELGGKGDNICFKLNVVQMGVTKWGKPATSCVVVQDVDGEHTASNTETEKVSKARKSFESALIKYGYIDSDKMLYVTSDNWMQCEIEENRHLKDTTCRAYITKTDRYPASLEGFIKPKNGGYVVFDESKFQGIRLLMGKF